MRSSYSRWCSGVRIYTGSPNGNVYVDLKETWDDLSPWIWLLYRSVFNRDDGHFHTILIQVNGSGSSATSVIRWSVLRNALHLLVE